MNNNDSFNRILAIAPLYIWQFLFLIIPAILLIFNGLFTKNTSTNIISFIIESGFIKTLFRSLFYSSVSAFICLILGYMAVYCMFQINSFYRKICLFFLSIPFLMNFLIHMMSWLSILKPYSTLSKILYKLKLLNVGGTILYTQKAVIIGYVYCYLPFCILPIYLSFPKMNLNFLRASYDLGGTRIQTFFKVLIPTTKNAIKNGFFLVFIPSFGEFIIPEILGGDYFMLSGAALSSVLLNYSLIHNASFMTIIFILFLLLSSLIFNFIIEKLIYIMGKI